MFNTPIPQTPGRVNPEGERYMPQTAAVKSGEEVQEEKVQVYVDHQRVQMGEIAKMPPDWMLWDLIFEDSAQAELIRQYFHDWAIPPHKAYTDENGKPIRKIIASKTFYRGNVTESSFQPEQHIYVVLNNLLEPCSDFGNPEGTDVSKMSILAAVFIGDTRRNGYLSNAYVEYACRLNTPWRDWVTVASRIFDPSVGRPVTYYDISGDPEIRADLTTKWFRTPNDYTFNGVIYPVSQNGQTSI